MRYPLICKEKKAVLSFLNRFDDSGSDLHFSTSDKNGEKQYEDLLPVIQFLEEEGYVEQQGYMRATDVSLTMPRDIAKQDIKKTNAKERKEKWRPITISFWALGVAVCSIIMSVITFIGGRI